MPKYKGPFVSNRQAVMDDFLGAIFAPIFYIVAPIFAAALQIILWVAYFLVRSLFRSAFLSAHSQGLARVAYGVAFLLCVYLVIAILRGFIPALASPEISLYFNPYFVLVAALIIGVFIVIPFEISDYDRQTSNGSPMSFDLSNITIPREVIGLLFLAVLIGISSVWSETIRVPTMKERFCEKVRFELSPKMAARTETGLDFLEGKFNRDLRSKIPCKSE